MRAAGMKSIRSLLTDEQGNFAMMTAITLPLLLGAAGAGLEMTRVMQIKDDLQNAADSATLAVATDARLNEGKKTDAQYAQDVKLLMKHYSAGSLEEDADNTLDSATDPVASRSETSRGTIFNISATVNYPIALNPMLGFIGLKTMNLSISSTAQSSFNKGAAMSLYLVLDRSGSMSFKTDTVDSSKSSCQNYTDTNWSSYPNLKASKPCYVNKSTSLKTAVSYLVDTLNRSDISYKAGGSPESTFVRTGAIAYNDSSFSAQALNWGTSKANTYVQAIPQYPTGGTNAYDALNTAFTALKSTNATETAAHKANSNLSFQRFIVLMTDGEMTGNSASWNGTIDAQVRTTCAAAKTDGIKIFTVAFMAPDKGKSLLQACASSTDNYYAPENMEQIVAAFGDIARKAASIPSRLTN
ncbi:VWA domain-containing protein [Agrobacterium larrymoorei]|uniref:VWA domain-containing protein n=3 Tax=Agrobacterium larrymoorei TaxID=160699 RepID=A0A4D7DPF8_9HYPH|nr:VWA domain-containing protein [Agrobacterium larrymoorei]QYA08437.1 VWA domain-containing protein [Agrobacterium larrymoorei]